MKRVLMFVIVLLAISILTPGIGAVHGGAVRTGFTGAFEMLATWAGDIRLLKSGIMLQMAAEASGPVGSNDSRLTGTLEIFLNVVFNLNTGNGNAWGTFVVSNVGGTFEGKFENRDTGYVFYTGIAEGRGTGAYEGLLMRFEMAGMDWYRDADPATNGITGTCTGSILSP